MKTVKMTLPVQMLWQHREFNRITKKATTTSMFIPTPCINDLSRDIAKNGLKTPIDFSVCNGKGLVTDGNHRLGTFKMGGLEMIDVNVTFYDEDSASQMFFPQTLNRFRRINSQLANCLN